jgi:hypothetical protein
MSEANNNFDELKRLLKLKQHEIPPPGYFNHFSADVVARIRAGETGGPQGFLDRFESGSFVMGLLQVFQAKPGVIGGFATSLCLLLLIGVVMAERPDGSAASVDLMNPQTAQADSTGDSQGLASVALAPAGNSGITISTNPVASLQPVVALFGSQQNPLFQPVGFVQSSH